jgi:4-methylaminobutanoate oxidase (formaldehyde-forming)
MTAREIHLAGATILAIRVTYVGELGWELHIPVEFAATVYDRLTEAGAPFGMVDAGYRAIESLRLEKSYRAWGAEIGPDHTPPMAGLGWAVKLKSGVPFQGREALEKASASPLPRLLAGFTVDDPEVALLGRETIYRNGERVGWLASGGFGYTICKPIGYGYVRNAVGVDRAYVLQGDYELDVAGERVPARVSLSPFVDPSGARIRC